MYNDNICDLSYQSTTALCHHENTKHKETEKFCCKDCGKQFTYKGNLKDHVNSIHLGIKHRCDQCDKEFTSLSNKTTHIKSVHNQIRYPCNMCNYQAKQKSNLNSHKKSAHSGV